MKSHCNGKMYGVSVFIVNELCTWGLWLEGTFTEKNTFAKIPGKDVKVGLKNTKIKEGN